MVKRDQKLEKIETVVTDRLFSQLQGNPLKNHIATTKSLSWN